jgi:tetratricopeptide (TPR) repeat protein
MYAETPATATNALKLAQHEVIARQDVGTLDAYAWALYVNGKYQEANATMQKVPAVGIPRIFNHAGHIAQKLNNSVDATKYFQRSVQVDPSSEYADDARKSLGFPTGADGSEEKTAKFDSAIEPASAVPDTAAFRQSSAPEDGIFHCVRIPFIRIHRATVSRREFSFQQKADLFFWLCGKHSYRHFWIRCLPIARLAGTVRSADQADRGKQP